MSDLEIYVLNVGQADTTVIKTPGGKIILIDAVKPTKLKKVLSALAGAASGTISHLILTHPHSDHYSGVASLLAAGWKVERATLPPFWYDPGAPGYHQVINALYADPATQVRFFSGYERMYPDATSFPFDNELCLELLGPPNDILEELQESGRLDMNHLSIIARLSAGKGGKFRMVFAADAQMENWFPFDRESMAEGSCTALKAAHHGSKNGTQWEKLDGLKPEVVVVSSDPAGQHELPDLVGGAVFHHYATKNPSALVALTDSSGTVRILVDPATGSRTVECYGETKEQDPFSQTPVALATSDWKALVQSRI